MSLINSLNVADATQALCERPDRLLSSHRASDAEDTSQARRSVSGAVAPGWKMGIHSPPSARRHPAASTVFGTPVASSSCAGDRVRSAMEAVSSMARFAVSKQAAATTPPRNLLPPEPPVTLELDDAADANLPISHRVLGDGKPRRRGSSKRGAVRGGVGRGSFQEAGVGRARIVSSGSDGGPVQMSSSKVLYATAPSPSVAVSAVPHTSQQVEQANQVATPVHVQSRASHLSGTVASHNQANAMPASNALRSIVMGQDVKLQLKASAVSHGVKEPPATPQSAGPKFQSPASVTNLVVKNRFIHSRPVTGLKLSEKVPAPNAVSSLQTPINGALVVSTAWNQSNSNMVPTCLLGVSGLPAGIMKVAVPFASPVKTISAGASTSADGLVRPLDGPISTSVSLAMPHCPICRFSEISVIAPNCFKCMRPECSQQFYGGMQGLQQRRGIHATSGNATAVFYGVQHHQVVSSPTSLAMLNHITCALTSSNLPPPPLPSGGNRKRSSCGTPTKGLLRRKSQPAECIDLVSSDEEESGKKRSCPDPGLRTSNPSAVNSADSNSDQSVTLVSTPRLADRMKLQDGTRPTSEPTPSPRPPTPVTPSSAVAPSSSAVSGPQVDALYWFNCGSAMFGELHGKALAPVRVTESRIFLSLECQILRNSSLTTEKYTLSVGKIDIGAVKVYFGRCPSLVAISTAPRFSEVACKRIGKDVLNPASPDPRKRHIILALSHAFQSDVEAAKEMSSFVAAVSPWAPVEILTLQHAIAIVQEAQLFVSQMEISLSPPESLTPVQTLFVYPPPPTPGGIPITTDDLACLADGVYLNDVIIDFYLKYTFDRVLTQEQREKTYIFNSYFYKRMTQRQGTKFSAESMHAQVKKWTRSVDIFSKDFIVIPVNEHSHWYLVIVCFPGSALLNDKAADEKDEEEEDAEEESSDFVKEEGLAEDALAHKSSVGAEAVSADHGGTKTIRAVSQSADSVVLRVPSEVGLVHGDLHSAVRRSESNVTHEAVEEIAYAHPHPKEIAAAGLEESADQPARMVGDGDATVIRNELNEAGKIFVKSEPAELASSEKSQHVQATDMDAFHRPCILIFDSLVGSGHSRVFSNLRNYLTQEWSCRKPGEPGRVFNKSNMKGCYPKIPRQNNDCDCGVFLLEYAEAFFVKPVKCYRMPMFLDNWFSLETVAGKRGRLKDLIKKLTEELCVEKT